MNIEGMFAMKRLFALVLTFILLLNVMPVTSHAAKEPEFVTIGIDQGDLRQYSVIVADKDLLFSGEDLSAITGYSYEVKKENAYFTRGKKVNCVDLKKNKLYAMHGLGRGKKTGYDITVQKVDNTYYYSGAQMLPWLNVSCGVKDGALWVFADAVSIWDFIDEFKPEEHRFDYEACCRELNVNGDRLKRRAYIRQKGPGMIMDIIPVDWDVTVGGYEDYYNIFDDLFKNKDSAAYAFKELTETASTVKSGFDYIEKLGEYEDLPDELKAVSAFADALEGASDAADLAVYYATFQEDNAEKIAMMDAITLNESVYAFPEEMTFAASQVRESYQNVWKGLETKLVFLVEEKVLSALVANTNNIVSEALSLLDMPVPQKVNWMEGISRINKYEKISNCSLDVFNKEKTATRELSVRDTRCHAQLYLYACEQNWRAMAAYAKNSNKKDLEKKYLEKAENALAWQGKFLAAANKAAQINDSHEYTSGVAKQKYSEELLAMFAKLKPLNTKKNDNLVGQWNLYAGGERDNKGNWSDIDWYTLELKKDGTATISYGIVQSEGYALYQGSWAAFLENENHYRIQLDVKGGYAATGEKWPADAHSLQLKVTCKGNKLQIDECVGDKVCLVVKENYEKNLSSDTWIKRQTESIESQGPDASYAGDWGYDHISGSSWERVLTIRSIEKDKIIFDLFYYRLANFENQTAVINSDGTASFTVKEGDSTVEGVLGFNDGVVTVKIIQSYHDNVDTDTVEYGRMTEDAASSSVKPADWNSASDGEVIGAYIALFSKIMYQHEDVYDVRVLTSGPDKLDRTMPGFCGWEMVYVQVNSEWLADSGQPMYLLGSDKEVIFYTSLGSSSGWVYDWSGNLVQDYVGTSMQSYILDMIQ